MVYSDQLREYLGTLLREEGITEVVVGIPMTLKGEVGFQAKRVLDTLRVLKDAFPAVHFVEWDERFTTRLARLSRSGPKVDSRKGGRTGRHKRGGKERVDHLVAAGMLQEYLDRRERLEAFRRGSSS